MDKFEKLVEQIENEMAEEGTPVSRAEAEEMARMELSAKENKFYAQADKVKTDRKPREKKIDDDKKKIIEILAKTLTDNGYSATITNVDKYIEFGEYTVNLIKHRPKK